MRPCAVEKNRSGGSPMTLRSDCDGLSCSNSPQIPAKKHRTNKSVVHISPAALALSVLSSADSSSSLHRKVNTVHFEQFHRNEHFAKEKAKNRRGGSQNSSSSYSSSDDSTVVFDHDHRERKETRSCYRLRDTRTSSSSSSSGTNSIRNLRGGVSQREEEIAFQVPHNINRNLRISATVSSPANLTENGFGLEQCSRTLDQTANKSDYSYSNSFDYVSGATPTRPCPNPAMSRDRTLLNNNSTTKSNGSVDCRHVRHYVVQNSFGLDSESEDELYSTALQGLHRTKSGTSSKRRSSFTTIICFFSVFLNSVGSTAIARLLFKFGSVFYCCLSSVHLFDTWLLLCIRSLARKMKTNFVFWLIPLFLMFLIFGAGRYLPNVFTNVPFAVLPPSQPVEPVPNTVSQDPSYFARGLDVAREFFYGFPSWFDSEHNEIEPSETSQRSNIDQSRVLRMIQEELAATRKSDKDAAQTSKEQMNLYSRMEAVLLRLEEKVIKLENAHEALSRNFRNCCRNHTEYSEMVEQQIARALSRILAEDDDDSSDDDVVSEVDSGVKWRLSSFKSWIAAKFVTKDNLENEMERRAKNELSENTKLEIEALSKAVAMAVATKHLESYESSTLPPQQSSTEATVDSTTKTAVGSTVSEAFVMGVVKKALHLYNADKTGMADFALETAGGSVVSTRCSETYHIRTAQLSIFGIPLWYVANSPRTAIQNGIQPGECWAFKGSQGYLVIQLSALIKPTAFSIEHIPRSLATTGKIDSAPREFKVLGLKDEKDTNGVVLGKYTYDQNGEPLQFFIVKDQDVGSFHVVELQIESNHGNPDYTCLYRFRVHGEVQNS